jgi:hypothetical protein
MSSSSRVLLNQPRFDFVVCRRSILAEVHAANLAVAYGLAGEFIATDNISEFTPDMLQQIFGLSVLILGSYYRKSIRKIRETVTAKAELLVIVNDSIPHESSIRGKICSTVMSMIENSLESDKLDRKGIYDHLRSNAQRCSVRTLNGDDMLTPDEISRRPALDLRIAELLDGYLSGAYTEENCNLQHAIYNITEGDNVVKSLALLQTCRNENTLTELIKSGRALREPLIRQAEAVAKTANSVVWRGLEIRYACAPSPIVESTMQLAKQSRDGLGLLIRYNYTPQPSKTAKHTLISLHSSGQHDAAQIAEALAGGGGSAHSAGGGINVILTPEDLFRQACRNGESASFATLYNPQPWALESRIQEAYMMSLISLLGSDSGLRSMYSDDCIRIEHSDFSLSIKLTREENKNPTATITITSGASSKDPKLLRSMSVDRAQVALFSHDMNWMICKRFHTFITGKREEEKPSSDSDEEEKEETNAIFTTNLLKKVNTVELCELYSSKIAELFGSAVGQQTANSRTGFSIKYGNHVLRIRFKNDPGCTATVTYSVEQSKMRKLVLSTVEVDYAHVDLICSSTLDEICTRFHDYIKSDTSSKMQPSSAETAPESQ